ncbi:hypothetical protein CVT24_013332 [Panaeolus cyanescens]|uniref:DUF7330 domain-containing protein n=1 Tax=Panaeolus cyanescens TaxID=181874 RepID=A0A409WAE0_9AGAR|nr:hypothetical protein CVT24_013332 [Panaeolus cyanescens]
MSSSDHSTLSLEKTHPLITTSSSRGTHKVKYQPNADWDFHLDAGARPIDMSLMLPHYRARHQPVDHRMSMFVANDDECVKLKVCRNLPSSKFYLEVMADTSDVTIYLPSDFKGSIHISSPKSTKFSSGFVNRILKNARMGPLKSKSHSKSTSPASRSSSPSSRSSSSALRLTQLQDDSDDDSDDDDSYNYNDGESDDTMVYEDEVVVNTRGRVMFRMWDIRTGCVENTGREGLKRLFGCSRKAPEMPIDWDCLLKD